MGVPLGLVPLHLDTFQKTDVMQGMTHQNLSFKQYTNEIVNRKAIIMSNIAYNLVTDETATHP